MAEILTETEASTETKHTATKTDPSETKTESTETKGQSGGQDEEPFISESEAEARVGTTIFDTESDGGNMHGGNDPDNLATGSPEGNSYLAKIGVAPAQPVEGNINYLLEGKKDVEVSNIALTNAQVEEVTSFISSTNQLSSLCLRNAGIDDEMFGLIAEALKSSEAKPMMLNLNLNKMTSGCVDRLTEMLADKPTVEILLLHGNPLGDEGIKKLVNSILDIHQASSQKEAEAQQEITKGEVTKACVLKELDLGDTDIGDEGIRYVASLLENETNLRTLNLNGNTKVTYSGWKRLAKALKKNKTLKTLTLDFNKIGDEGVAVLVNCLKVNTSLTTLDLESTGLTEEGGKQLVDLVKCNTTIMDVTVQPGNRISEKTQDEIRNYLGLNKAAASKTNAKM